MVRRLLRLSVLLILLGAVAGVAGVGVSRHVDARSGLVRIVVITRARVAAPATAPSVVLRRRLAELVRGVRLPGRPVLRVAHAPAVTVAPPSQSCPVFGRRCSLQPCVLFARSAGVVLRFPTVVLRLPTVVLRSLVGPRRRTAVAVIPVARRSGGRRGLRAAGCRRLRAGALPVS